MSKFQRFLGLYSGVLTLALIGTTVSGFANKDAAKFDEITVHRINVVEPDGTLRLVISNHDSLPGIIVRGKEQPFDRPQAGMIFYNGEGSETGGLIFGGRKNAQGEVENSGASLSFDKYDANQIVQLVGVDDAQNKFAGLRIVDSVTGTDNRLRIWVGRDDSGTARVRLNDEKGKKRIEMQVEPDGVANLVFFDADGNVVRKLP